MILNTQKYLAYLDDFEMSTAQKEEMLRTIWSMMEATVDRAFHMHPVQHARTITTPEQKMNLQRSHSKLDSDTALLHQEFLHAAKPVYEGGHSST